MISNDTHVKISTFIGLMCIKKSFPIPLYHQASPPPAWTATQSRKDLVLRLCQILILPSAMSQQNWRFIRWCFLSLEQFAVGEEDTVASVYWSWLTKILCGFLSLQHIHTNMLCVQIMFYTLCMIFSWFFFLLSPKDCSAGKCQLQLLLHYYTGSFCFFSPTESIVKNSCPVSTHPTAIKTFT